MRRGWKLWVYVALIGVFVFTAPIGAGATVGTVVDRSEAVSFAAPSFQDESDDDDPEAEDADDVKIRENGGGGGGKNVVRVRNRSDGRLRVRGRIQLNRISGPTVEPINLAFAYSTCTDCQTIAVALQLNLISRTATYVAPQNVAIAVNYECSGCRTVARALQYTYSVDDPNAEVAEVRDLIREMERELRAVRQSRGITVDEAEARVNAVVA